MKTVKKIALLIAAISPAPYTVIMTLLLIRVMNSDSAEHIIRYTAILSIGGAISSLFFIAVTVYYIYHIVRNPNARDRIPHWIILILLTGPIGQTIYWCHHIWNENRAPEPE
jgi:uncharacterized Fe-S cluster-containing radical SAM superfamily enzyme